MEGRGPGDPTRGGGETPRGGGVEDRMDDIRGEDGPPFGDNGGDCSLEGCP